MCDICSDLPKFPTDRTYRLGIMGGTFDPIHYGHLVCAEQVREDLNLDHVVFIPAGNPAFKQDRKIASGDDRFAMCLLATSDNPDFSASYLELAGEGVTYTVNTLRAMREHYSDNVELFFITGADVVSQIPSWKDAELLGQYANIVAATRPGYDLDCMSEALEASGIDLNVHYVEVPALAISSSHLRSRVKSHQTLRYLTPVSVGGYIAKKGLYLDSDE